VEARGEALSSTLAELVEHTYRDAASLALRDGMRAEA